MGFSRQEYWSGLPFPSPEDLPDSGIEPGSPEFQADALHSKSPGKHGEWGLFSSCGAQPSSHCGGFSCCRTQALGHSGFKSCGTWAQ